MVINRKILTDQYRFGADKISGKRDVTP